MNVSVLCMYTYHACVNLKSEGIEARQRLEQITD